MPFPSLIIRVSESDESSKTEAAIMGRQVKVNLVELFKESFNDCGQIVERNGIRNEECLWL
jgi:regulator of replication initiation timing